MKTPTPWTQLDAQTEALHQDASLMALLWAIVREAQRSGRPPNEELGQLCAVVQRIGEASRALRAGLGEPPAPPAR